MLGLVDPGGHDAVLKLHVRGGQHDDLHRHAGAAAHEQTHAREIAERDADLERPVSGRPDHAVQNLGGQGVDSGHIAADGRDLARVVFLEVHKALAVVVPLRHNLRDHRVDLGGHQIAGVGDCDAARDVLQEHRRAGEKEAEAREEQHEREAGSNPSGG